MIACSQKRALLIASPYGGLQGPLNDVKLMTRSLKTQGFEIIECYAAQATRNGILKAWQDLIKETRVNDTIVIYYSGHGGLVEKGDGGRRYQFLVPTDFDKTTREDFKGILDVQLSHLLQETTQKTHNVTIILDCCHAGRMTRDPSHTNAAATPKFLEGVQHHELVDHTEYLHATGQLGEEIHVEGNPYAVRIVAAAANETAWEYRNRGGLLCGAMTEALVQVIDEASDHRVSWRTALLRVKELVTSAFPQQHPHVEGPDTRLHFSIETRVSGALAISLEDNGTLIIQAGRIAGVYEGNTYDVYPHGSEDLRTEDRLAEVTVARINGFEAIVKRRNEVLMAPMPKEGALAFLTKQALPRKPVSIPIGLEDLHGIVEKSQYLRCRGSGEHIESLAEFRRGSESIELWTNSGVQIISRPFSALPLSSLSCHEMITAAEQLARAQHLLSLSPETAIEMFEHGLIIEWNVVKGNERVRSISLDGRDELSEGEYICITMRNPGTQAAFVSVLNVNVAGKIALLSQSYPQGIELQPGSSYTLGEDQFRSRLPGLGLSWPEGVSRQRSINEWLSLVITSRATDLRHLDTGKSGRHSMSNMSSLERLTYQISSGRSRDVASYSHSDPTRFDVMQIPFTLRPIQARCREPQSQPVPSSPTCQPPLLSEDVDATQQSLPAMELPEPDAFLELDDAAPDQNITLAPKGAIGAMLRASQGIPACVWIINQHTEEITVVVSKHRPDRLLSGGGLNAGLTSAGLTYTTTTYLTPATKKTLPGAAGDKESAKVCFPLWTRRDGFGVVSIFIGVEKVLYIENDRIPLGATGYFMNKPDLRVVEYGSE